MTETHTWHISNHARPTFCNVCRETLSGVTSHGLSCGICKLKAHKSCVANILTVCKWSTLDSVDPKCITEDQSGKQMHHQWVEGNLPVSSKCVVCDKNCGSVLRLQDWRCLWCRATVHTTCRSSYIQHCSLGPTRHATVPPTKLIKFPDGSWKVQLPLPGSPLVVFVNSKSGDGHGDRFLRRFRQILNPSQVFDLSNGGPTFGLEVFRGLAPLRLLICGGDGSIGWVLKEIDNLQMKAESVCVSVLPLGTGNDLARVCGWGAAIEDDVNLVNLLEKYDVGSPRLLDRWSIMSVKSRASISEVALREAPSISEHQNALGEQVGDMKTRLNDFLNSSGSEEMEDYLDELQREFFVLQKILSDVTNSSEEKTELFGVANETSDLLEDMAASMASRKGSISTDSIEKDEDSNVSYSRNPESMTSGSLVKLDSEFASSTGDLYTGPTTSITPSTFSMKVPRRLTKQIALDVNKSLKSLLFDLKTKLERLEQLLLAADTEEEGNDEDQKHVEKDPIILVTAPSTESEEDDYRKHAVFPGSGGKLFQTNNLPSPMKNVFSNFANTGEDGASRSESQEESGFDPSLTTSFPFPPIKIPVCVASVNLDDVPGQEPPMLQLEPTPSIKSKRKQSNQSELDKEDNLSGKLSISSVTLDSISSSSSSSSDEEDESTTRQSIKRRPGSLVPCSQTNSNKPVEAQPVLTVEEQPQGSADLLSISPLPSPGSRHGSIFVAAADLGAPSEFSDGLLVLRRATSQNMADEDDSFEAKDLATAQAESAAAAQATLDTLSPPSSMTDGAPMRSRSRLSSRLSSVPEDSTVEKGISQASESSAGGATVIQNEDSVTSIECEYEYKEQAMARRPSGSRRLSVGAMVSLSTLRSETGSRLSNKTIPLINPLVKNPNWPNLDHSSSRGLISMVVLASADALCAPVTPIMDWTPPPDKMEEISVMNNYFGIGIDAKISLDFHNKREESSKSRSRTKNLMWYGVLGSRELVQKTYKNLEKRVILECDGEAIPLPSLQGIVVLNIQSFMGGTNFWGSAKEDNIFLPPSFDDGILEVVAVFGSIHMGASRIMNLQRHRIAQCRSVVIRILGNEGVPVQVDGEAWVHPPGIIRILHKNRVQLICRDRTMEQQVRSGSNARGWYREHAHPVLLPLDEEEMHLLRSLVGAARQLLHYLMLLHHALDGREGRDLASLANILQESMATIPCDNVVSLPAAESRRRAALFVNHLRNCIASCKRTLVENLQEAQSDVAGKLSQSIYWVESILSKCHEEGDLLFFTIRTDSSHDSGRRSSWFRSLPLFGRNSQQSSTAAYGGLGMPGLGGMTGHGHSSASTTSAKKSSNCLVEVVLQWSPQDVTQWLESIGLPMYSHAFLEHEISGTELMSLERRDFKDVGVSKVGHIKRLQHGIKDIQHGKLPPRLLQSSCMASTNPPASDPNLEPIQGVPVTISASGIPIATTTLPGSGIGCGFSTIVPTTKYN